MSSKCRVFHPCTCALISSTVSQPGDCTKPPICRYTQHASFWMRRPHDRAAWVLVASDSPLALPGILPMQFLAQSLSQIELRVTRNNPAVALRRSRVSPRTGPFLRRQAHSPCERRVRPVFPAAAPAYDPCQYLNPIRLLRVPAQNLWRAVGGTVVDNNPTYGLHRLREYRLKSMLNVSSSFLTGEMRTYESCSIIKLPLSYVCADTATREASHNCHSSWPQEVKVVIRVHRKPRQKQRIVGRVGRSR